MIQKFSAFLLISLLPLTAWGQIYEVPANAHPVVAYLNDNGITVERFGGFGSDPEYNQKIGPFFEILEAVKTDIVDRKDNIETVLLSTYTSHRLQSNNLSVDVNHDVETLSAYLPLLDRKVKLLKGLKLEFDMGIDMHSPEIEEMDAFKSRLDFWQQNLPKARELYPVIRKVERHRTLSKIYLEFGTMTLAEESYQKDFKVFHQELFSVAESFEPARDKKFKVEFTHDLEKQAHRKAFKALGKALKDNRQALTKVITSPRVEEMKFSPIRDETLYFRNIGSFLVAGSDRGLKAYPEVFKALATEMEMAETVDAKIRYASEKLNERYINSITRGAEFTDLMTSKKDKIEEIYFASFNKTEFIRGTLYFNGEDSDDKIREVITGIE